MTKAPADAWSHYQGSLDCVHCGLCLESCPTYDVLGSESDSPRGRILLMRALAEGRVNQVADMRLHLDRCLDCRACESACPSGVRYGEILEQTRGAILQHWPDKSLSARLRRLMLSQLMARPGRLRAVFHLLRLAEVSGLRRLAEWLRIVPPLTRELVPRVPPASERRPRAGVHEPTGTPRGTVAMFDGCVMPMLFGSVQEATLQLLLANGFRVLVPPSQTCCGALLVHNGQVEQARDLARQNVGAFADVDWVIHNSAGCGAAMKEYGHLLGDQGTDLAAKSRDVLQFLGEQGLAAEPARRQLRVAYDDPCHLCHGQGVRLAPRELLAQVPGLEVVMHADPEDCCGSAGIYNMTQPELAERIGSKKVTSLLAVEPDVIATGNPGCMMQIRVHLARAGAEVPVVHPVELLLP